MSITLKELYDESKNKYKLKLLAGSYSIDNVISWVHFMEDESTINFIRGNELIITTGLGSKNTQWLDNLIKGLINRQASGLMVNIGPYISEIPKHTIQLCNNNNFPLLTIPWEVHLVDIMQDYCNNIMKAEQNNSNICAAFFNAIFCPDKIDSYIPDLKQAGYDLNGEFIVISFELDKSVYEKNNNIRLKNFIMRIENTLNSFLFKYSIFVQNDEFNIIINFTNNNGSFDLIKNHLLNRLKDFSSLIHYIGISSLVQSISSLHTAYKEACDAKLVSIKNNDFMVYYDDIGIDKLLLNITDNKILNKLYDKYLGAIHDYDKIHNTGYEDILEIYIKNNGSIQAVSKETYTHRNTINYRIKKIKDILNSELNNSEEIFNLMLAFHIKDILTMNNDIRKQ